jgi:hypothetical protein
MSHEGGLSHMKQIQGCNNLVVARHALYNTSAHMSDSMLILDIFKVVRITFSNSNHCFKEEPDWG